MIMKRLAPSVLSADFSKLGEDGKDNRRCGRASDSRGRHGRAFCSQYHHRAGGDEKSRTMDIDAFRCPSDDLRSGQVRSAVCNASDGVYHRTLHAEACTHLHRTLQSIRALGVKAGVALNPATSLSAVEYVADLADLSFGHVGRSGVRRTVFHPFGAGKGTASGGSESRERLYF